jgi:predicted outer membrane repeat protein
MRTQSIPRWICGGCLFLCTLTAPALAQSVWFVNIDAGSHGVGTSWLDATPDLQMALTVSQPQDQIWVAAGTYLPTQIAGERSADFVIPDGVAVLGGFSGDELTASQRNPDLNPTILSGAIPLSPGGGQGDGNSFHVVRLMGVGSDTLLDGFTIRDGVADGIAFDHHHRGGGMVIESGSPIVRNCRFESNLASDSGGAVMIKVQATPLIENCRFIANEADKGGAISVSNASPVIRGCTFVENTAGASGGAIYNSSAAGPLISDCVFQGNSAASQGGAVYNFTTALASVGISRCLFEANQARAGGALFNWNAIVNVYNCRFVQNLSQFTGGAVQNQGNSSSVFANCIFNGNMATGSGADGGAMFNTNSVGPTIVGCTFHANTASDDAGGIFNTGTSLPVIANSIFWANSDSGPQDQSAQIKVAGGVTLIDYSCVQGWTGSLGGAENYGTNPVFFNANGPDGVPGTADDRLWLKPGSPYIDAADKDRLPADVFDYDADGLTDEAISCDIRMKRRAIASSCVSFYDTDDTYAVDTGSYELLQGDTEGDGDVDLVDFGQYLLCTSVQCFTPPCPPLYIDSHCGCVDFDSDGDVDLVDFGVFQISFTGN